MEPIDIELQKVMDSANRITNSIDYSKSIKELFEEKQNSLGLSNRQIEKLLGMDWKTIIPIIEEKGKRLDVVNVIKVAHFLDISVNDFMKLHIPEMSPEQIGEIQRAREAGYILSNFDITSLTKLGFLQKNETVENIKNRLIKFFNLKCIYDYTDSQIFPAFSRTKRLSNELIRNFWVSSAYTQFQSISNPNKYNRKLLIDLMPKIRPYTRNEENGLVIVAKALYNAGVTVIYQPHIQNLQVRGATFSCNNKPCIVLSDLYKHYPTLWFTLLHELYHVLYDWDEINERKYHLSGEEDLFLLNEMAADDFAKDYLLSSDRLKYISTYINAKTVVESCSKEWGVHPSIIYIFYITAMGDGGWRLPIARKIPNMEKALKSFNTNTFDNEQLTESAKSIKELIYNI